MFDLIEVRPSLPTIPDLEAAARLTEDTAASDHFIVRSRSENTVRAYATDWRDFCTWCAGRNLAPMPASADAVRAYLAHLATSGIKASSISRRVSAIRAAHKMANVDHLPTSAESVRMTLGGIRRELGVKPNRKSALTHRLLRRMLTQCQATTAIGLRDRALLLIGFGAALRRSELVALDLGDIVREERGVRVIIRRSKTDQEAEGAEVAILAGSRLKPVAALDAWLAFAGITEGALFRPIAKGSRIQPGRMRAADVARVVKRAAEAAGLDPAQFSGHSLRAGFITSAVEAGAPVDRIRDISRHGSVDILMAYVRRRDQWEDHAGEAFL